MLEVKVGMLWRHDVPYKIAANLNLIPQIIIVHNRIVLLSTAYYAIADASHK